MRQTLKIIIKITGRAKVLNNGFISRSSLVSTDETDFKNTNNSFLDQNENKIRITRKKDQENIQKQLDSSQLKIMLSRT